MLHICCAGECENGSDKRPKLSFHMLPLENKPLMKTWITIMQRNPNYFNVNKHVKICSQRILSFWAQENVDEKGQLKNFRDSIIQN